MGGCRETKSLWFRIKKVIRPYSSYFGRWKGFKDLLRFVFSIRTYRDRYFWHDTFGRYFNQLFFCSIFGHVNVRWLDDGGCSDEKPKHYCFNCENEVDPGIDKIKGES